MAWQSYNLDKEAHDLVFRYRDKDALNQSYKMRMAVPYGLERFWGEQFRLEKSDRNKAQYWRDTWTKLVSILQKAGIILPNDAVNSNEDIQNMSKKLWEFDQKQRKIAIAILTQLTESMVWWTQRYK